MSESPPAASRRGFSCLRAEIDRQITKSAVYTGMVTEGLTLEVQRGLDAIHAFFDPDSRHKEDYNKLSGSLAELRQDQVPTSLIRGLGKAAIYLYEPMSLKDDQPQACLQKNDLLAYDISQLTLIDPNNEQHVHEAADFAKITPERFREVQEIAELEAETTANHIADLIDMITEDPDVRKIVNERLDYEIGADTPKIVTAGLLLADAAHEGQTRKNIDPSRGNNDYFNHPLAAATLYQMAWENAARNHEHERLQAKPEDMHRQIFRILMHDVFEDSIPSKERAGRSYMEGDLLRVTPLLAEKLLTRLGDTQENAAKTVNDIILVTKSRGLENETVPLEQYAESFCQTIGAMITKFADTAQNKNLDPKKIAVDTNGISYDPKTYFEYMYIMNKIYQELGDKMRDDWGVICLTEMMRISTRQAEFYKYAPLVRLGRPRLDTDVFALVV